MYHSNMLLNESPRSRESDKLLEDNREGETDEHLVTVDLVFLFGDGELDGVGGVGVNVAASSGGIHMARP